jgi:S-DNA-T family DNA segregation ATPase FtsK/SpoIIIE
LPAEYRKDFKVDGSPVAQAAPLNRDADLPGLELLMEEKGAKPDEKHINHQAGLLEKTLAEFGIPARVVNFQVGPTVTQFAVEPGYLKDDPDGTRQKVRVSQILGLQRDLALALSAQRLRIQAPVPGRSYVGVEVPNRHSSIVRLRPILESQEFHHLDSALAIALGRDVSGTPLAADLSKMPHLLVAGTTGSGKSVLISAITICLAMNNSPADLRLVMLDPKMVELVRFNGLPHLIGQVETELERITSVLRWVVGEMQRRYKLLEEARARDINGYNQKLGSKSGETLPRIVVLIDELADLMMNSAEHTESTLVRLAQMARATGIHLVVATQRPSTDVVTGLIKANFPARISFAVASAIDSRVVLDSSGAEQLLGRGDMLYLAPEAANPKRSQGVMITDKEIESVVSYWQDAWQADETDKAPWDEMIQKDAILGDRDDLIEDAIEEIRRSGKSSASHLQRALKVGYPRAARLVDELEDMGVLGASLGGGREREILLDLDNFDLQDELEDEFDDDFED